MKLLTIMICAMTIVGCGTPYTYTDNPATSATSVVWSRDSATEDEIFTLKQQVIKALKDPDSAKFGEFWALSGTNGERSVCGYVNAKNSFGGYVGNKMITTSRGVVIIEGGGSLGSLLPEICMPRTVK